jgi:DNA-binding MarR family transcriptional regulator
VSARSLRRVLKTRTLDLIVRTPSPPDSLASTLLGQSRAALLALLFEHPDESFQSRQLARYAAISPGTVHRELASLVALGLVLREVDEAAVRFRANVAASVYPELKGLLAKTSGASQLLRAALGKLGAAVRVAFIYGSIATGKARANSDIDLMIIGAVSLSTALKALRPAIERLRRDVNPSVYPAAEFALKSQQGHSFIRRIMAKPKIFLIGDEHELGQLSQDRKAASLTGARSDKRKNLRSALAGGDKRTQDKDIQTALELARNL